MPAASSSPPPLPLTGERTVPGVPDETYWFTRHVAAYRHAGRLCAGRRVLDAGCGEGYGLRLLAAAGAAHVLGVDLDGPTARHAGAAHGGPRVAVAQAALEALPLADGAVDTTVSLQVVEHVTDVAAYLVELRRVTRRGGRVVLATPNRLTFTPGGGPPVNPFHVREFTGPELRAEVHAAGLRAEALLGVHHGPRLAAEETAAGRALPERLVAGPPSTWTAALRTHVHATTAADFALHGRDVDASLDLLLTCTVP